MEMSIVVPARDEEQSIGRTLEGILSLGLKDSEIIVVDGASSDRTVELVRKFPVRVAHQSPARLGKGNGLRLGFQRAKGKKVIWIDADETYPVSAIPAVALSLEEFDVVVCSRRFSKENVPKFNRFGNWLFKVLIRGIYGFEGSDPCTGLYGVRREHLKRMRLTSERFAIEPEISIKAGRMRLLTRDIPIRYKPRIGQSKLNPVKVGFEDMWTIIKFIGWRPK